MARERIFSKAAVGESVTNPDEIQDRMVENAYIHHSHGGREHGHDWDDWLKANRALKFDHRRKRGYSKP